MSMDWPANELTAMLGIRYPLIQAPMAGITTAAMAAAVGEQGALGSLGGAMLPPEQLREQIRTVRGLSGEPLNVNLFAPQEPVDPGDSVELMQEALAPWRARLGLGEPRPPRTPSFGFDDQLAVVLEEIPEVFSFTFGIPPPEPLATLRAARIKVLGTATSAEEGELLESAGCDAVVAQGSEAGGHRGTFAGPFEQALVPTLELVAQIVERVEVPVIAAGGIMDGAGIAAALGAGAAAAQLGTAFLACDESAAPPAYRQSLLEASGDDTTITRAFTGRPLRGLRTAFVDQIETSGTEIPPYPLQALLLAELREAGLEQGQLDVVGRLTGEGVGELREGSAAELTRALIEEAEAAADRR
jgi:nitronate monooxygenase